MNKFSEYLFDKGVAALIFITLLTVVPILFKIIFFSFAPMSWIAETHSVKIEDMQFQETTHVITINRTIHYPHDADVVRELTLYSADGNEIIYTRTADLIDRKADGVIKITYEIPEGLLVPGQEYFWRINIIRHFGYGVTRISVLKSNVFEVYE